MREAWAFSTVEGKAADLPSDYKFFSAVFLDHGNDCECAFERFGPLSIDWTARIEKITQFDRTFVRIEKV
jgi:hypothetical protein